jgi:ribosome biogenesis protein UTP30
LPTHSSPLTRRSQAPHALYNSPETRICLITADPPPGNPDAYKDLKKHPDFPKDLKEKLRKVIRFSKLAKNYKSFESRRKLLAEYDVFLADERIVHLIPSALGSVFYKSGTKRPISVSLTGKELWGKKQKKTALDRLKPKQRGAPGEGPAVIGKPEDVGAAIETALSTIVVNLSPTTSLSIKVAYAGWPAEWIAANVSAAVEKIVPKYVPGQWNGVKSLYIKGPDTAALPIYMTEEIWDADRVLDEGEEPAVEERPKKVRGKKSKGKQRLIEDADPSGEKSKKSKKRKLDEDVVVTTTRTKKTKVIVVESSMEADEETLEKRIVQEDLIKEVAKQMKEDSNLPSSSKPKPQEKKTRRKGRKA